MRNLHLILSSFLATHALAMNFSDGSFGNYAFLHQSALGKCAERDGHAFASALWGALDHAPDGGIVEWRNDKTGYFGKIQVLKDSGAASDCRLARIATSYNSVIGNDLYQFCKKNGKWVAHGLTVN